MIIQYENEKVYMLPAWPVEWDVHFKVNAPGNTTIEGIFENGKIVRIKTTPENKNVLLQW
jgi:hypothetical protein